MTQQQVKLWHNEDDFYDDDDDDDDDDDEIIESYEGYQKRKARRHR